MKRVYKYATGQDIPKDAVYLWSCKNGDMPGNITSGINYKLVWHYFLVEVEDGKTQS